jgi:crotonobetainyl-CoA:carnitine CoA-transferase CaiB-like acyl-CoA transferase
MERTGPMAGVRIVELATFGFVPSGVALLADWGADVIKVEHPRIPDPMRGLVVASSEDGVAVDVLIDQFNRGKRNLALDVAAPQGRDVLYELVRGCDVVVTSFLRPAQRKLRVTYEDLRAINASLIYAHGHGYGPRGPDAEQPGFDGISYWARGGVGHALTYTDGPPAGQRPGFGDVMGGLSLATGVSAALYQRGVTGRGCAVDVSLLGVACWQLAPDILTSWLTGQDVQRPAPTATTGPFRTSDGRFVTVLLLLPHYLGNVLRALGQEALLENQVFRDFAGGLTPAGAREVDAALRAAIGSFTEDQIRKRFAGLEIAWSIVQTPQEVVVDPQVVANEYVVVNPSNPGGRLVTGPVQFDQSPPRIASGAPRQGEHSEQILREIGYSDESIGQLHDGGVIVQGDEDRWDAFGRLST